MLTVGSISIFCQALVSLHWATLIQVWQVL
ncbi:uncharacterized protein METZ01_LOCUS378410, partial [marine metagenome]